MDSKGREGHRDGVTFVLKAYVREPGTPGLDNEGHRREAAPGAGLGLFLFSQALQAWSCIRLPRPGLVEPVTVSSEEGRVP